MPTIENKAQLIEKLLDSRKALEKMIARVDPENMLCSGVCGEWSGKDVLAHVAHWQKMHLEWWSAEQRGVHPQVPATGYSWSRDDVDRLNHQIFIEHRDKSLEDVLVFFRETFLQFMALIEATPEEDLFCPGLVSFTGKATLARWYRDYAFHDGFGRNRIYNALVRNKVASSQLDEQ